MHAGAFSLLSLRSFLPSPLAEQLLPPYLGREGVWVKGRAHKGHAASQDFPTLLPSDQLSVFLELKALQDAELSAPQPEIWANQVTLVTGVQSLCIPWEEWHL